MGQVHEFEKEKLIVAALYSAPDVLEEAMGLLTGTFGPCDRVSADYAFSEEFSPYYDKELGGKAVRRLYSFENRRDPSELATIKLLTNEIERRFSDGEKRRINLDPGMIGPGRLILASTKDAGHRIPLSGGIYAELTLFYARGRWNPFPWTYLDFQKDTVQKFLLEVRGDYMRARRQQLHDG